MIHVLNGDAILPLFEQSALKGEVIVWREILCEGPLSQLINEKFWTERQAFLTTEYKASLNDLLPTQFKMLNNYSGEITLWFEYDVFCQLNLLGAVNYFTQNHPNLKFYLVCVGYDEDLNLKTLSDFTAQEYKELYLNKTEITTNHKIVYAQVWENVCNQKWEDALNNANLLLNHNQYLHWALEHWIQEKTNKPIGLLSFRMLLTINEEKPKNINSLVKLMLQKNQWFGFGDLQYFKMVEKLKPYIDTTTSPLELTKKGRQIVK